MRGGKESEAEKLFLSIIEQNTVSEGVGKNENEK